MSVIILGSGVTGQSACHKLKQLQIPYQIYDDIKTYVQLGDGSIEHTISSIQEIHWTCVKSIIVSPGISYWPQPHAVILEAQKRMIPVITDVDLFQLLYPKAPIIAVTGTVGKTTVAHMIAHILKVCGLNVSCSGNSIKPLLHEPTTDIDVYVIEMSSTQLEKSCVFGFNVAILTNLSDHHLKMHGNFFNYINAKMRVFWNAKCAVINAQDSITKTLLNNIYSIMNCTTAFKDQPYDTHNILMLLNNQSYTPIINDELPLALAHKHIQSNFGLAYLACRAFVEYNHNDYKVTLRTLLQNLSYAFYSFKTLEHRQEIIVQYDHLIVVNDSKSTTPSATMAALDNFENIYLIMGGKWENESFIPLIPYMNKVKYCCLIGEAAQHIADTFNLYNNSGITNIVYSQHQDLKLALLDMLSRIPHDIPNAEYKNSINTLLLSPSCPSFDQFQSFEHRGEVFRELIEELLVKSSHV